MLCFSCVPCFICLIALMDEAMPVGHFCAIISQVVVSILSNLREAFSVSLKCFFCLPHSLLPAVCSPKRSCLAMCLSGIWVTWSAQWICALFNWVWTDGRNALDKNVVSGIWSCHLLPCYPAKLSSVEVVELSCMSLIQNPHCIGIQKDSKYHSLFLDLPTQWSAIY